MKKKFLVLMFIMSSICFAQEEETFSKHFNASFLLSHTNIRQGVVDGNIKWLVLPSSTLDFNYVFAPKWSVGIHNDIILENYKVESGDEVIERSIPIASAFVAGYKPGEHFTYQFGLGGEFATEENFFLTRLGLEYGLELPGEWELIANFVYDIKWDAYDSFSLGIGVLKSF
jgi:hypothetical protein